jgi:hypothetical protein
MNIASIKHAAIVEHHLGFFFCFGSVYTSWAEVRRDHRIDRGVFIIPIELSLSCESSRCAQFAFLLKCELARW